MTFTKIKFIEGGHYRFGIGNATTTLGSNKFLTVQDGQLLPAAAKPTTNGTPISRYWELATLPRALMAASATSMWKPTSPS